MSYSNSKKICVGVIVAAHGINGMVKIKSFTKDPGGLARYKNIYNFDHSRLFSIGVKSVTQDIVLATIDGTNDRTQAEKLSKTKLYVDRSELGPTNENEFYTADLIGMDVVDDSGKNIGKMLYVHNFGAGDIVEIQFKDSYDTQMLSFNTTNFPEIDLARGVLKANIQNSG